MPTPHGLPRSVAAFGIALTMATGLSAGGSSSTRDSALPQSSGSSAKKSSTLQSSAATVPLSSDTSTRAASQNSTGSQPSSSSSNAVSATGAQSKVTFALPTGFKVFDSKALQDNASLAELSKITGMPVESLRLPSSALDLNAVSLHKESGGTSNILLFVANPNTAVPDEETAKEMIAQTGSTYVSYRATQTSLGRAAVVESNDPSSTGGTITHEDLYLPPHDGVGTQVTISAISAQRARQLADLVASSIKASA